MTNKPVTPSQPHDAGVEEAARRTAILMAVEFGYKACENGSNLQKAISDADKTVARVAARSSPATTAPDGWKLVPVEPTEAMQHAAADLHPEVYDSPKAVYAAMLAAAPPAHDGETK